MRRLTTTGAALALTMCLGPSIGQAGPLFAGFPPPGGTTFSSTGVALTDAGGRTRSYSGFDTTGASWSNLYFGIETGSVTPAVGTGISFNADHGVDGGFGWNIQILSGNTLTYELGTISFPSASTDVRLVMDYFQNDGVTPLSITDFILTTPGDGMPVYSLSMSTADLIAWGGGFKVRQRYQTSPGGAPLLPFFDANDTIGSSLSSATNGAFWYDAPVQSEVPEPSSLLLLGGGFLMAARRFRRSKSA